MSSKKIVSIVVLLLIGYAAINSAFIVNERQRAVVIQLGEIVGQDYEPGLHFKLPFVQNVRKFNKRVMTFKSDIERVLTSENKNLSVDYFVKWRISDTVDYFLGSHGNQARAQALITQIVENDLLAEFSKREMRQAINDDRNEIASVVLAKANEEVKDLGVEIFDVRIMHLDLPKKVREAVYSRMRSEREEVIRALKAQGDAVAQEIRSDAERERTARLAQARAKAKGITGAGAAGATEIYAAAFEKDPEFYKFYRSLRMYRESFKKGDLLILPPKGELFEYINPESLNP